MKEILNFPVDFHCYIFYVGPPREYLENYVFPYLLPAIEAMLVNAKKARCFERKRTKFNALDFITEYLYK